MDNTKQEKTSLSRSVLIISSDHELTETIISNNSSGFSILARETWDEVLNEPSLLTNTGITILDIDGFDDAKKSVKQLIKIKQDDPTQVLMVVGEKEPLADFLKSTSQALVYRAFSKPTNPGQILLAFTHGMNSHEELIVRRDAGEDLTLVGPAENRTTLDTMSDPGKTNPLLYAAAGLAAVVIIAWLALNRSEPEQAPISVNRPDISIEQTNIQDVLLPDISEINTLNQLAANALLDGRLISPAGNNALEYYNQVLEIDSYDNTAYEGRHEIANQLRADYPDLIESAQLGQAFNSLEAVKTLQPLNPQNDTLALTLKSRIEQHVEQVRATGSQEEIAKTSSLTDIGTKIKSSQQLPNALETETEMLKEIDLAISNEIILPSQEGNAYNLLSDAIKKNSISKLNIKPRLLSLSDKLMLQANVNLENDQLDDVEKILSLVKNLNVNKEKALLTESQLKARREAIALALVPDNTLDKAVSLEEAEPEQAKILPAKILKRPPPTYPQRAIERDIEGWVELSFGIDIKGRPYDISVLDSEPSDIFNKEALKSVKKWRFSPARNELTNEPITTLVMSTKVTFMLQSE